PGYDAAGRLQTITLPTGTITATRDPITGKLATLAGPSGETLTWGYDGPLVTSAALTGPVAGTVTVTYDNDFRVATNTVNNAPPSVASRRRPRASTASRTTTTTPTTRAAD